MYMDAGGMDWVGVGPHTCAELGEGMAPTPERNLAEARGAVSTLPWAQLLNSEVDSNLRCIGPPTWLGRPLLVHSTYMPLFMYFVILSMVSNQINIIR